ncbi:HlyD family efflux transporter periplasmic adaptor subunit [Pseudomonas syringae group genomosp. 3]|uniref:Putative secretion protein n=1 Tax=Pseudomonas syringae pv. primulae TaxID=251707 RepID=A0A3M3YAJ7_9PSED|nr:HlyD family efflux transporter periplasmic adaptor subunit [Pseudomonas syringae group genomosp. 3]RMO79045.1 putative secretion protein [Pseudomonas syringae pv. primulae]RMU38036.1 putative secretion protein [Pseudomonas syringae pv. primulae]
MTPETPLFRPEALSSRQINWLGEIILVRPVSFTVLSLIALFFTATVVTFIICASYTKRSTVQGQLIYASGQLKIHSPQYGLVLQRFVEEGQSVKKGDKLFHLSSERFSEDSVPVQQEVSHKLAQRCRSLEDELIKKKQVQDEERKSLNSKLENLQKELIALQKQTVSQKQLIQLATNAVRRYQGLMDKGYISMDQLQQRQSELLGQQQTLQGLAREMASLTQQFVECQHEFLSLSATHDNQLSSIKRLLSTAQQELTESEAKRTLTITAPQDGVATAILVEPGQTVDSSRLLMSILPEQSRLQAELYSPSKSIGFIHVGDSVMIRYQAYPYQRFGQHKGKVLSISKTTLSGRELASMTGSVPGLGIDGEQIYRIRVEIEFQSVLAFGEQRPLQNGMLIEADILQETRRLYEWVLEPLYSLTRKF